MARKRNVTVGTGRIKREYLCYAHGPFEGYEEVCPSGCTTVERRFYSPVAIRGVATTMDKHLQNLADDFSLTDLRNDAGSVMESLRKGKSTDFSPKWGAVGEKMGPGVLAGAPPTNQVESMKEILTPPKPMIVGNFGSKDLLR